MISASCRGKQVGYFGGRRGDCIPSTTFVPVTYLFYMKAEAKKTAKTA